MTDGKIIVRFPLRLIADNEYNRFLPKLVRAKIIQKLEAIGGDSVELDMEELQSIDEELHNEQVSKGFDQNYGLNEYGRYLDDLIEVIEKVKLCQR